MRVSPSVRNWFQVVCRCAFTWRMSSLWTARASSVHVRVRAISSRSRAEGDTPAAAALLLPGGVLRRRDVGGDHYGAAIRHGHTGTGFGGRCPRPPAAPAAAREAGGSKGGTRPPLASFAMFNIAWAGSGTFRGAGQPPGKRVGRSRRRGISGRLASIPRTKRPGPSGVNSPNQCDFQRVPAPSRMRTSLRQWFLRRIPKS